MFEKIYQIKEVIKAILNLRLYALIFFFTSIVFFAIFYILTVANIADQSIKIFIMMSGLWYTITQLILLGIISLLFGLFVVLFVYKIKFIKQTSTKHGVFGTIGLIVGLFSAGCPMCGSVLFALFGAPLALFFLPFKGLELKLLSIIILAISTYLLGKSFLDCKVPSEKP